jgi:putative ABC transport system permease protein
MTLLYYASWRFMAKHPLQLLLSILGVALGVAVVVGIDLASYSAREGFKVSAESIAGSTTHQIIGNTDGVPEQVYVQIRTELGFQKAAPLIRAYVSLTQFDNQTVQLLGIDPFSDSGVRAFAQETFEQLDSESLQSLLIKPATMLVSESFLQRYGLKKGDKLQVRIGNITQALEIVDSFSITSSPQLQNWLLCDISTAQEILKLSGFLSQIDLVIEETDTARLEEIKALLPNGVQITEVGEQSRALARLSDSFELNLTALSLLSLLVGMFLIYNTMMFSVLQRREILARLRVMGVTRKEMLVTVLGEALLIALIATLLGLLMGWLLAKLLIILITQTINDLYYVLQVSQLQWSTLSVIKAIGLGLGASLLSAGIPALEAAYTRPVSVLQRFNIEQKIQRWNRWLLLPGLLGCVLVYFIIRWQIGGIITGFAAVFLLIISLTLLLPWITQYLLIGLSHIMGFFFSLPGKMAVKNIANSLSRTMIAIAALTIAVSATLGLGMMIDSFRHTVDEWLGGYFKADFYVTPIALETGNSLSSLTPSLINQISQIEGVRLLSSSRRIRFYLDDQFHNLMVLDIPQSSFSAFRLKEGNIALAKKAYFEEEGVIISEPYAYRHRLKVGDIIKLPTDKGIRGFKVAGIFYDYGSEHGVINMSRKTYRQFWSDTLINSVGVYLEQGAQSHQVQAQILQMRDSPDIQVISKAKLHEESMKVFDRTFRITHILKLLVIIVAFVGILSALMAIQLERARDFAILRAIGVTPKQLAALVGIETFSMGLIAAVLAIPMGVAMAYMLIDVINFRSFGWSMQFVMNIQAFITSTLLAIIAALVAGFYPAWHLSKTQPALVLRGE